MVEWGNYWAKAIKLRDYQHTEAYMGLFSQIGELYNVKVLNFIHFHKDTEPSRKKLYFFLWAYQELYVKGKSHPQFPFLEVHAMRWSICN